MSLARTHKDLRVWRNAIDVGMLIFEKSKHFPGHEQFSMTDQIRRSSRSVAANIAEAWRKRRYVAAFRAKLNDAEAEACETQTHIEFAVRCQYISAETAQNWESKYEEILAQLALMIRDADTWCDPMSH